ncbi:MAG: lysophospholipase L1-like esterase [Saprospiraceae bacterium]|jgi:lysophospholipase L1-like esterase
MKCETTIKFIFLILFAMLSTNISSQDWANLEKYKAANEALPEIQKGEKRIVFMGNSIIEGWVNMRPDFFSENPFVGRGISGQTTPQMLLRMRQDVLNLNPDAVVILAGTNDIAGNTGPMTLDEILGNIISMAELADTIGIKVILCSVLPAYDYPWRPGIEPNIKIPALNNMIEAYSETKGFCYLDYFSEMADERNGLPKKYAEDEVHPTELGYSVMEPMVLKAIVKVLKKK